MKLFAPRFLIALVIAAATGCLSLDTPDDGVAVLTVVTGNEQTVQSGKTAAAPLVIRAFDNSAGPMEGVSVTWTVNPSTGGSVSLSSTTTDESGFSEVTFTGGTTLGTVFVRAEADGLTVSFTLTVVAASG